MNNCNCDKPKCPPKLPPQVIEIVNEAGPVLFHTVPFEASLGDDITVPPETLDYKNVLLVYQANNHAYLYSSDGIPTLISMGELSTEAIEQAIAELQRDLASETLARSNADEHLQDQIDTLNSFEALTNLEINGNDSTVILDMYSSPLGGEQMGGSLIFPVASRLEAGVMNAATFRAVALNSTNINSILQGAVAVTGLPAEPTQETLTQDWKTATGLGALINRASIFDVDNQKLWYYYTNTGEWYSVNNTAEVTVAQFTNEMAGIIKGSENSGQLYAEADGTGSVVGWDGLQHDIDNLSQLVAGIDVPKVPTYVVGGSSQSASDWANIHKATDSTRLVQAFLVKDTTSGTSSVSEELFPQASSSSDGVMSTTDKTKLDSLATITSIGENLELTDEGVLNATGGGSDVNLLAVYNASPVEGDVYNAGYVNKRLDGDEVILGSGAIRYNPAKGIGVTIGKLSNGNASGIAIGYQSDVGESGVTIGFQSKGHTNGIAIGYQANNSSKNSAIALGHSAINTRNGEVSIGNPNLTATFKTRFLANVTAGELPTDAVNLQQMQDYVAEYGGGGGTGGNDPRLTDQGATRANNLGVGTLTNLDGVTPTEDSVEVEFTRLNLTTGGFLPVSASIPSVDGDTAGVMLPEDKTKLDSITPLTEMQHTRVTNLPPAVVTGFEDTTYASDSLVMHLDTKDLATGGVSVQELTLAGATSTSAGVMTAAQATLLQNTADAIGNINTALATLISGGGAQ